jgi:hypothetical protein
MLSPGLASARPHASRIRSASSGCTRSKVFVPTSSPGSKPSTRPNAGLPYSSVPSASRIATGSEAFSISERKRSSLARSSSTSARERCSLSRSRRSDSTRSVMSWLIPITPTTRPRVGSRCGDFDTSSTRRPRPGTSTSSSKVCASPDSSTCRSRAISRAARAAGSRSASRRPTISDTGRPMTLAVASFTST